MVTVALGGDGADELFAGYDPFRALRKANIYNHLLPKPIHSAILRIIDILPVSHVNMSLDFKIKRTLRGISYNKKIWNSVWLGALAPDEVSDLFNDSCDIEEVYSDAIECWDRCTQSNMIDKTLQFYTNLYLQNDILPKIDRASMLNSLEVRAPFLDIDLVNFVRKIPARYKYRNGQTKYILKKALEPILPKRILYRSKKGFGVPIGKWFKNRSLSLPQQVPFTNLNTVFITSQTHTHLHNKKDNRSFLWNLWLLERHLNRDAET
jgi:asparagine synthase (glutamine-hydrolysing)